jgi:hypothetical protein
MINCHFFVQFGQCSPAFLTLVFMASCSYMCADVAWESVHKCAFFDQQVRSPMAAQSEPDLMHMCA